VAELTLKELKDLYENGKHRRYSLLFSVNGGAFLVAKVLMGEACKGVVLGSLSLTDLSIGMAAFTAVMAFDIYKFGDKMRKLPNGDDEFHWAGKTVLFMIGGLICTGWLLAGLG
jgi:hypothetical protein